MSHDEHFRVEPLAEPVDPSPDGMTQTGPACFAVRRWYALLSFFADGGVTDITNYL